MKRRISVIAASGLPAAITLSAITLSAMTLSAMTLSVMMLSPPSGANAAAKARILTYTEHGSVNFTGLGGNSGHYSRSWGNERVELGPRLAFAASLHTAYRLNGVHTSSSQLDIVGGRRYTRRGNGPWQGTTLAPGQLRTWRQELDPDVALVKFTALPGVRRVAARHYRVSGTYAKIGSFLSWEYGLTAASFKGTGIKTLTIDLWLDSSRRPVKITSAARSSDIAFSVAETFGNYNKPVVIRVP